MYVWLHAHENYPDLPKVESSGLMLGPDGIEFIWTKSNIIPQEIIDTLCTNQDEMVGNSPDADG